jgi:hypothetical protein
MLFLEAFLSGSLSFWRILAASLLILEPRALARSVAKLCARLTPCKRFDRSLTLCALSLFSWLEKPTARDGAAGVQRQKRFGPSRLEAFPTIRRRVFKTA